MKRLLEEIIKTWWSEPFPLVKPRTIKLSEFFDPKIKKILSVIGFRRTGKTFTLFDFAKGYGKQQCIYINFEDERLPADVQVLSRLIEVIKELKGSQPLVLLLDEIQEIPGWSVWARRVNETTPYHLILSGSSSKLSSKEIPTELRGQTLSIQISPLNWREFIQFKGLNLQETAIPQVLNTAREYITFGGLPEIVLAEEGIKPLLLTEYYNTFVLRDVIERYHLRNAEALKDLLRLILNTRTYTYTKLANTLKSLGHGAGKATIIRYMHWLESTFFLSTVELCSPNVKRRIQAAKKAYIIDTYFCSRFSNVFSQNLGSLMEQAVWGELERKRFHDPLLEIFYWKDYLQHEVDFVVMRNQIVKEIIQVTYAHNLSEIAERELNSLLKAAKELKCSNLTVITWEFESKMEMKGHIVNCIPFWKWLL
ncbi:MAG: ATPase [Candidatus Saganbacteria bacterium]|uniref:ATPase n=1 Tax=Candidatus Saganbacteria bacterium TaxID=2575572 RepID=A0A833L117_UNCSA|nr:MAG: ATPase [Candidatus Saganbacteria bacterium]